LRLKKFKEKLEKGKKVGSGKKGIRKDGFQVALIGLTNSGKSYLITQLTNATSKISINKFTTSLPVVGTMNFEGVKAQIVDLPASGSKDFDYGVVNNAEEIYKGFHRQVKETRLTGPSGKFSNQRVGLTHKLKDMDVLEFKA
jgi:ribosome-interacting GTPase 1